MDIPFRCTHCGNVSLAENRLAGQEVSCPRCGEAVAVPRVAEGKKLKCPCGSILTIPIADAKRRFECASCGRALAAIGLDAFLDRNAATYVSPDQVGVLGHLRGRVHLTRAEQAARDLEKQREKERRERDRAKAQMEKHAETPPAALRGADTQGLASLQDVYAPGEATSRPAPAPPPLPADLSLDRIPAKLRKYIDGSERLIFFGRPSVIVLLIRMLVTALPFFLAYMVVSKLPRDIPLPRILVTFAEAGILAVGMFLLLLVFLDWLNTFYCVTHVRTMLQTGIFGIRLFVVPNPSIHMLVLTRGLLDRILGLGTIRIASAAGWIKLRFVDGVDEVARYYGRHFAEKAERP